MRFNADSVCQKNMSNKVKCKLGFIINYGDFCAIDELNKNRILSAYDIIYT